MYHADPTIDAAIRAAHRSHPYYATAIARLRIEADPSVPTMATSALWVTHYNPTFVATLSADEAGAVLVHELEHLLRQHHDRCGDRDPGRFNIAGDAEINQTLPGLPTGAIYPETLGMPRGRTAEVYYGANEPQPEPEEGEGEGEGAPQDGDGSGSGGEGEGEGDGEGAEGDAKGSGSGKPSAGKPQPGAACGSAAGGPLQPHEEGDAKHPGSGARDDGKTARREVAEQVLQSVGQPGIEPGTELREWAEREVGIDRSAWYAALAGTVGHVMAPHGAPTRWQWPGRRDARDMGGAMVPRWTGERPSCAVVIDTSGSITPFDLDMAAAAGHYIARVADVRFYACDMTAVPLGSVLPEDLPGGGGTDLRVGIAMAIREGAKAVVVITDCETPWPTEPTTVPIIVGANPSATRIVNGERLREYQRLYPQGYLPTDHWMYGPPDWMTVLAVVADAAS